MRPTPAEYYSYFERYVSLVPESDVLSALSKQLKAAEEPWATRLEERAGFRYAEGKWTVRELLGHVIDTERVFGYRALSIARGETTSLPGMDEKQYASASGHDQCAARELVDEFAALRRSHVLMFRHLPESVWTKIGRVNEHPTSTRALAFIMVGHVRHHAEILVSRYGIEIPA